MNAEFGNSHQRSKALGLVRNDISGPETPRHTDQIRRHAQQLGYTYLYTVRPPATAPDPIAYALHIATGVDAAALVVFDLATVDNTPSRVCHRCDLETVNPPETWACATPIDGAHSHPDQPLNVPEAHRIMQQHRTCPATRCPRKASAVNCLVRAGKIVPPIDTPRERAAARGLRFPSLDHSPMPTGPVPDLRTLRHIVAGLSESLDR